MNKPELDDFLDYAYKCPPEMRDKIFRSEFQMSVKEFWESGLYDEAEELPPEPPETRDGFDNATWDFFGTLAAREAIYKEQNTARN